MEEVARGLAILRDGDLPLTNVDPYIGPLWNYVLAGAFWFFGPSPGLPRALVFGAGVLTVLATYVLGRFLFGRFVGMLAATLLGFSAVHTAVNSHVAWSNCVTPLFTTAGLAILARSLRDDRPRLLLPTGLLLGLAFHTHPTAVPVLIGAAVAALVHRREWLRGPWPLLAFVGAATVNVNLVVYNLMTGGRTLSYAVEIQQSYVRETDATASYGVRLMNLMLGLARGLGGVLDQRTTLAGYLGEPLLLIAVGLTTLGLVLTVRHRIWLPILVVGATVLILPLANPKYDPILNGRYLAPILPICLVWMAVALSWLSQQPLISSRRLRFGGRDPIAYWPGLALAVTLATSLIAGSLGSLDRYYQHVRENARTGERILEVARTARVLGPMAQPVVLDERLDKLALGPGAGITLRVLRTTLELEGIQTVEMWLGEERPQNVHAGQLVVLAARSKPRFTAEAVTGLGLRSANGGRAKPHSQASLYGVYRFGPAALSAQRSR